MSEMSNTPQSISCSGGVVVVVVVGFGLVVVGFGLVVVVDGPDDGPDGGAVEAAATVVLDAPGSGSAAVAPVVVTTGAATDGADAFSLLSRADAHAETASAATASGASTPQGRPQRRLMCRAPGWSG
ncbi:MAG: hypothetical protein M3Q72_12040, partial [Actinomycetota bacterium]|nr:hypothetical protein [Actinomycetota bacterium]